MSISNILTNLFALKQKIRIKNTFADVASNVLALKKVFEEHKEICLTILHILKKFKITFLAVFLTKLCVLMIDLARRCSFFREKNKFVETILIEMKLQKE